MREVLNDERVIDRTFRKLTISTLIGRLAVSKCNLLVIGTSNSYVINAKTHHPNHFIGTKHAVGLSSKASEINSWKRIKELALRYVASGSEVLVYCLNQ